MIILFHAIRENGCDKEDILNGEEIKQLNTTLTDLRISVAEAITKQDERHKENKDKFETIFYKLDDIGSIGDVRKDLNRLHWIVFVVVILGILLKLGT